MDAVAPVALGEEPGDKILPVGGEGRLLVVFGEGGQIVPEGGGQSLHVLNGGGMVIGRAEIGPELLTVGKGMDKVGGVCAQEGVRNIQVVAVDPGPVFPLSGPGDHSGGVVRLSLGEKADVVLIDVGGTI